MAAVPGPRIGRLDSTIWDLPQGTGRSSWAGSNGFANWTWSSPRSGTANSATTSTSETPMGLLWSSTPPMTVSRLPWLSCAAASSPTKSYWTGRSSWDWGRTSLGESHDSFGDLAGPARRGQTGGSTGEAHRGLGPARRGRTGRRRHHGHGDPADRPFGDRLIRCGPGLHGVEFRGCRRPAGTPPPPQRRGLAAAGRGHSMACPNDLGRGRPVTAGPPCRRAGRGVAGLAGGLAVAAAAGPDGNTSPAALPRRRSAVS